MENTHKIAERCHVEIEFGVTKAARNLMCRKDIRSWEYLNELCERTWKRTLSAVTEELLEETGL